MCDGWGSRRVPSSRFLVKTVGLFSLPPYPHPYTYSPRQRIPSYNWPTLPLSSHPPVVDLHIPPNRSPAMSTSPPPSPSLVHNGVGPCPTTLKSILRRRLCYKLASSSTTSVDSTTSCRSVKFNEEIDEHPADEWDRSSCAVACPTSRYATWTREITFPLSSSRIVTFLCDV